MNRPTSCWLLVAACCCTLGVASTVGAQAVQAQDAADYDEVFFEFRYNRLVDGIITALFDGEGFLLSLQDVLDPLQINLEIDPAAQVASGFYLDEDVRYRIDLANRTAQIGKRRITFAPEDAVVGELGFFVRPALLDTLFQFRTEVDLRSLSVAIDPPQPMPVDAAFARARGRRTIAPLLLVQEDAPLLYNRRRRLLGGAVLGYNLGATVIDGNSFFRFNFDVGAELLGGDIRGSVQGTVNDQAATLGYERIRWRFVPTDNLWLTQVRLGELNSVGLRPFSYVGVSLANNPIGIRRVFATYPVEGFAEPEWEVELYINNQLIGFTKADETGYYRFRVPLAYGTTLYTLRLYGPSGQVVERERRLQVPFTFVPVKRLYYQADLGEATQDGRLLGQMSAAFGVTRWLTNKIGLEFIGEPTDPNALLSAGRAGWQVYNQMTARVGAHHVVGLEVAPQARYMASVNAFFPSLLSYNVQYTRLVTGTIYNIGGTTERLEANASTPFRLAGLPMVARVNGRRNTIRDQHLYSIRSGLTAQLPASLRLLLNYQVGFNEGPGQPIRLNTSLLNTVLTYTIPRQGSHPRWWQGIFLTLDANYDAERQQLNKLGLDASRNLGRHGRLRLGVDYFAPSGEWGAEMQVAFNLPSARTTTIAQAQRGTTTFSQDLIGAIGYDGPNRDFVLEQQNWVGGAAAALRLFVDFNGNDRHDPGEEVIDGAKLRFRQALLQREGSDGIIRVHNLRAYDRYNVNIDRNTIPNPLWVPKVDSFSFVPDPNSFKPIDIPFYVSGIVEGSVLRELDGEIAPVPGLRVRLTEVATGEQRVLPVFRDGQFFEMGLRPGDYLAEVDAAQRALLGVTAAPIPFTVKVTEEGDWVEGVDFVLRPETGTPPPDPPILAEADPDALPTEEAPPAAPDAAQPPAVELPTAAPLPAGEPVTVESLLRARGYRFYEVPATGVQLPTLAEATYGAPQYWVQIWQANQGTVPDPQVVPPGLRLILPPPKPLTPNEQRILDLMGWTLTPLAEAAPADTPTPAEPVAAAPPTELVEENGQTYFVVPPGETSLMNIARKVYGEGRYWPKLWRANREAIPDPHLIEPGQRLRIPPKAPLSRNEQRILDIIHLGA